MRNTKETTFKVTRVFHGKREKLFELYANYVAKRIMYEKGMISMEDMNASEDTEKAILTLTV